MKRRALVLVDGFNLYHAIKNLNARGANNYLKWIDIRALAEQFLPKADYEIVGIKYFSAFAVHRPDAYRRHRAFVAALECTGVRAIMGKFKEKDRICFDCGSKWKAHEEKETDVNIAIHALNGAHRNEYDTAIFVTADSDIAPAVRMIKAETSKAVRILFPIGLWSTELSKAVGGKPNTPEMKMIHIERSLLPRELNDHNGVLRATRPREYDPPR